MRKIFFIQCCLLPVLLFTAVRAGAHSLPDTKAQIYVLENQVLIQFKTPVEIFELASHINVDLQSTVAIQAIKQYYLKHIAVADQLNSKWKLTTGNITINVDSNLAIGKYHELTTAIYLEPNNLQSLRNFSLNCDVVIHQVVNQSILFSLEQDWQNGIAGNENAMQVGSITIDPNTGKVQPLQIQLAKGSWWNGFMNMLHLGMQHIKEGTDHLMFLLVLLLPAMLLVKEKKWGMAGSNRNSLRRLLKIVTAFTIGHSCTLLIGSVGLIHLPQQPIEILIAVSIIISAVHCIYPLFAGREMYIAGSFGLVHGLAFATVLSGLQLNTVTMLLSVLGFNMGIELMQLLIVAMVIPWLVLVAKTAFYKYIRVAGAVTSIAASFGWIIERITGKANWITINVQMAAKNALWEIIALALFSIIIYRYWHYKQRKPTIGRTAVG